MIFPYSNSKLLKWYAVCHLASSLIVFKYGVRMNGKSIWLLIMFAILLTSCKFPTAIERYNLINTEWNLVEYRDDSGPQNIIPVDDESYTIMFYENGEIEAVDACNHCTGYFEILNGDSLIIDELSCTEMACASETWFSSMNGSYVYTISWLGLNISRDSELDHHSYSYFFEELR